MSALPFKCYYIAPNFRYEKPQKGRFRQHVQFGAECFGAPEPQADAEIIALAYTIIQGLDFFDMAPADVTLHLNSIGCKDCRPVYQQTLRSWLAERASGLCEHCRSRLERNPMRVLDCKIETCAGIAEDAPRISENLCLPCAGFTERLDALLDSSSIPHVRDPRIVRGFDYYTGTVFEFISKDIGAQGTICGGGRYDGLVEELGGPPTPALGFGMGLERLLMARGMAERKDKPSCDIYLAPMGDAASVVVAKLSRELRYLLLEAETDLCGRSLKAQMKYADKIGAKFTAVIGDDELTNNEVTVKNMQTGEKHTVRLEAIPIAKIAKEARP
jgi:histidyl-tRNA synthetase